MPKENSQSNGTSEIAVPHMSAEEFRSAGHDAVDFLVNFIDGFRTDSPDLPLTSDLAPGDVYASLPSSPPMKGEPFEAILADVERLIVPGLTNWQHPGFYGFFPADSSPPSVLGELVSAGLGQQGYNMLTGQINTLSGLGATVRGIQDRGFANQYRAATQMADEPYMRLSRGMQLLGQGSQFLPQFGTSVGTQQVGLGAYQQPSRLANIGSAITGGLQMYKNLGGTFGGGGGTGGQ